MLHSVLLLGVVLVLPFAAKIPHAVLAGILVKVGYDIIDIAYLKRAHQGPRFDLMLMALVLGLTVFVDLITAVMAGVVIRTGLRKADCGRTVKAVSGEGDGSEVALTEAEARFLGG